MRLIIAAVCLVPSWLACSSHAQEPQIPESADPETFATITSTITPISWGGLVYFDEVYDRNGERRIMLSLMDTERNVIRFPTNFHGMVCTYTTAKCVWPLVTTGWKPQLPELAKFRNLPVHLKIILRPDGERLKDADVRIYMNGHRLPDRTWLSPSKGTLVTEGDQPAL